jgi:hypothetical protein
MIKVLVGNYLWPVPPPIYYYQYAERKTISTTHINPDRSLADQTSFCSMLHLRRN